MPVRVEDLNARRSIKDAGLCDAGDRLLVATRVLQSPDVIATAPERDHCTLLGRLRKHNSEKTGLLPEHWQRTFAGESLVGRLRCGSTRVLQMRVINSPPFGALSSPIPFRSMHSCTSLGLHPPAPSASLVIDRSNWATRSTRTWWVSSCRTETSIAHHASRGCRYTNSRATGRRQRTRSRRCARALSIAAAGASSSRTSGPTDRQALTAPSSARTGGPSGAPARTPSACEGVQSSRAAISRNGGRPTLPKRAPTKTIGGPGQSSSTATSAAP